MVVIAKWFYTVKSAQVLHREGSSVLKRLKPRFQVVDHFNQETLEDQAALPATGRSYLYTITPVDFAGKPRTTPNSGRYPLSQRTTTSAR
jgi:hypothetical protein